jgi:beta-lactamase regulating signal transducer with metallopeptidase domain
MLIPLIVIPVKSNFPINNTIGRFTLMTGQIFQRETIIKSSSPLFTYQNILTAIFIIISSILFIRFALNIFRISRKILKSKKVYSPNTTLVLVEERTLPYSFFRYIFINHSDFENGKIEKELLEHEEAHCLQYHSIDIIIIELLNVFLWFNPAIWLFKKSILLNHEYYADDIVLTNRALIDYQQLLINLVMQDNSNYLVSNFKYSFIKNRLFMMTQRRPSNNAVLRKIAAVSLFLLLGITFAFSQENALNNNLSAIENGWWKPILKKHNFDLRKFNYKNIINMGMKDTTQSTLCLEMGNSDSLNNRKIPYKDAILISKGTGQTYWIIKSEYARHDVDNNILILKNGQMACYDFIYKNIIPTQTTTFQESTIDIKKNWMVTTATR